MTSINRKVKKAMGRILPAKLDSYNAALRKVYIENGQKRIHQLHATGGWWSFPNPQWRA